MITALIRRHGTSLAARALIVSALALPQAAFGAQNLGDFPKVYSKMMAAVNDLAKRRFRATVDVKLYASKGCMHTVTQIANLGPQRFRVDIKRPDAKDPGAMRPAETAIANAHGMLVIHYRNSRKEYIRYDGAKLSPKQRAELLTLPPDIYPLPIGKKDLKRFKFVGIVKLDGEDVAQYTCPPRKLAVTKAKGKTPGPATTGRITVWVNLNDLLPRRIIFSKPDGKPAIVKTYTGVDLRPRFDKSILRWFIPHDAYVMDGTAGGV